MQDVAPDTITPPWMDPETQASLRKRWHLLVPATFVTYSLAYLHRANFALWALLRDYP